MNNVIVFVRNQTDIVGYQAGDISGASASVIQDNNTVFDISKIQGYTLENREDGQHLIFDQEKYDNYIKQIEKEKAIEEANNKFNELTKEKIKDDILNNASEKDAYSMRYLYPEWDSNGVEYKKDQRLIYNDKFYKVLQNHTSQADWAPDVANSLYVEISDPSVEYPEFKQPTGAHDAYAKGAKITFNSEKYISLIDANVWSPTDYPAGWQKVS